jgi:hypothetical protein
MKTRTCSCVTLLKADSRILKFGFWCHGSQAARIERNTTVPTKQHQCGDHVAVSRLVQFGPITSAEREFENFDLACCAPNFDYIFLVKAVDRNKMSIASFLSLSNFIHEPYEFVIASQFYITMYVSDRDRRK